MATVVVTGKVEYVGKNKPRENAPQSYTIKVQDGVQWTLFLNDEQLDALGAHLPQKGEALEVAGSASIRLNDYGLNCLINDITRLETLRMVRADGTVV